jgi:hypothetical protein
MRVKGFAEDQIAGLCNMWGLGQPIDVAAFLKRQDIPKVAKDRVRKAGQTSERTHTALGKAYHLMQVAIVIEVAKLDKERWNDPAGGPE